MEKDKASIVADELKSLMDYRSPHKSRCRECVHMQAMGDNGVCHRNVFHFVVDLQASCSEWSNLK